MHRGKHVPRSIATSSGYDGLALRLGAKAVASVAPDTCATPAYCRRAQLITRTSLD